MSLDETCLSNGEVYTLVTNKAAHGRKGTLVAMIGGVATDVVSVVLHKLPSRLRNVVQTVATDLSSVMMLTVRRVFPQATLINGRFHVQQLMSEAIDQERIRLRWQVLEGENKTIKEHRDRRKAARNREEREATGHWEPCRMANGETMPQISQKQAHPPQTRIQMERAAKEPGGSAFHAISKSEGSIQAEYETNGFIQQKIHSRTGTPEPGNMV